jgi:hypothetical protein
MRVNPKIYARVISSAHRTGEKMKKTIKLILFVGLIVGVIQPAYADAPSKPVVVSFTMTPDSVDISIPGAVVSFDLVVSNPTGIASLNTRATLSDGASNSLSTLLIRTDSPVKASLSTVTFRGKLIIPPNVTNGAYFATANPIAALNSDGSNGYYTDLLYATTASKVVGAEDALLVRKSGDLNYNYSTFRGPSFDKTTGINFTDPKYQVAPTPSWSVGESFNPSDYYELSVRTLTLKIKSNTPTFCTSDGVTLKLISVGACSFTVYTDKTSDYQYQKNDQVVSITQRSKPKYVIGVIGTQSSTTLPFSIQGPFVYGPLGLVVPITATPAVCYTVGTYITVISGGTCTLNYSTAATDTYAASDVYPLTFQITRTAQTLLFTLPSAVLLASKSLPLSATSSSGGPVTFRSNSLSICSVTVNSLNLLRSGTCQVEAMQAGSPTISPVAVIQSIAVTGLSSVAANQVTAKKIVCVKNGKSKTFAVAKCPAGYKAKK